LLPVVDSGDKELTKLKRRYTVVAREATAFSCEINP
jgi:hypothetical protein